MKVRYVCDSCRTVIAEFDQPDFKSLNGLTAEQLGLDQLDAADWPTFVHQTAEAVVLSVLCDECASVLDASELPPMVPIKPQ